MVRAQVLDTYLISFFIFELVHTCGLLRVSFRNNQRIKVVYLKSFNFGSISTDFSKADGKEPISLIQFFEWEEK